MQTGAPANSAAHNRASAVQNSSATVTPSNPAALRTSQSSGASSSDQGDSQPSAFMAALMSAALDDSGTSLLAKPSATAGSNSTITTGRRLSAVKQPSKNGNQAAMAVAVPTSLTTPTILPLRFSFPSRDPDQERSANDALGQAAAAAVDGAASGIASRAVSSNPAVPTDSASEPAKRTADAAAAAESQTNSADDLTFAARVQPAKPVTESASAQPQPADTAAPEVKRVAAAASSSTGSPSTASSSGASDSNPPSGERDATPSAASSSSTTSSSTASSSLAAGAMAAFLQDDQIAATPQAMATPSSRAVEAIAPVVPKTAATPLQNISLQVGQAGAQKVEIRMVQQSGELQVAVRTGDADLSHGLQQGLSDLVGRLQESGFRAEAWRPGGPDLHSATVLETKSSSESSQSGDSQPGNGGSRQESGQRQHNPSRRPAWVDELETRLNNQNPTGESYGIRN